MSRYGNLISSSIPHHHHQQHSAQTSQRPPSGSRSSLSSRDDLSSQRYVLAQPDGVQPLTDQKTASNEYIYPDFFPWRKTAQEDDIVVKHLHKGYAVPPHFVDEYLSARNPMTSILHQAPSVLALSYLMSNAMKVRERAHRFTSSSTFKPPPRFTLTEQKKEAWLRDLANPTIPLRKLSRTIPHGTRNRSLLEQCCNKNIPISRAVWFARCVGANELRGLKRKGAAAVASSTGSSSSSSSINPQSSEAAWIREWTEQVTEYIEKIIRDFPSKSRQQQSQQPITITTATTTTTILTSSSPNETSAPSPHIMTYSSPSPSARPIVASPSTSSPSASSPSSIRPTTSFTSLKQQPPLPLPLPPPATTSWKAKLEYMLRLSEYLFAEDLLDKSLFLKWCISFFEFCSIQELPSALLFLKPFWNSILRSPALSRTLALALFKRYAAVSKDLELAHHPVCIYILSQIADYVKTLFILTPDIFVIPAHWKSIGPVLSQILKSNSSPMHGKELEELFTFISTRNENLIIADSSHVRALRNPHFLVIDALDRATLPFDWHAISQIVTSNNLSEHNILHTAFEWATTTSRIGSGRLYACLSLVSYWRSPPYQWDVSSAFMDFLESIKSASDYDMNNVYDLITEFLDRDWFCISTYLRRLISSGVLFIPRMRSLAQAQFQIVANLPAQFFPTDVRNQQIMLLKSLDLYDDHAETLKLQNVSQLLLNNLDFLSPDYLLFDSYESREYNELSRIVCDQISELTRGSQIELSLWIVNLLFEQLDRGFVPTISQFSLLQNTFEALRDPKSLYRAIEAIIPKITSKPDPLFADSAPTFLGFLATSIRDNLFSFSAIADVNQIIYLLVVQYKSLKNNRNMPRGLWDLVQYAWYCIQLWYSQNSSKVYGISPDAAPNINIDLRNELEDLLKPGGPGPGTGPNVPAINTLSPMSDFVPDSVTSAANNELNDLFESDDTVDLQNMAFDSTSVPKYFSTVISKFLDACGYSQDSNTPKPCDPSEIRHYIKILQRLREADVVTFNKTLVKWLLEKTEVSLKYPLPTNLAYNPLVMKRVMLFLIVYDCISLVALADMFYQRQTQLEHQYSQALQLYQQQYAHAHGPAASTQNALHQIHLQSHHLDRQNSSEAQDLQDTQQDPASDQALQLIKPAELPALGPMRLLLDLVSVKFVNDEQFQLKASEKLALNMHRHIFQRANPVLYVKFIVHEIIRGSSSGSMLDENDASFSEISSFLLWLSIADIDKFIEFFTEPIIKSGNERAIEVSNKITAHLLQTTTTTKIPKSTEADNITDVASELVKLAAICNDFNIHLCQAHFHTVLYILQARITKPLPNPRLQRKPQPEEFYDQAVAQILQLITVNTALIEKYEPRTIGDIIVHLSLPFKSRLLHRAELAFFQKSLDYEDNGTHSQLAYLFELIDAIADSSQVNTLATNRVEFADFLGRIVMAADLFFPTQTLSKKGKEENDDEEEEEGPMRKSILLLGKIIMIHSTALASAEDSRGLVGMILSGLARLLHSQYIQHDKKNLSGFLLDVANAVRTSATGLSTASNSGPGADDDAHPDVCSRQGSTVSSPAATVGGVTPGATSAVVNPGLSSRFGIDPSSVANSPVASGPGAGTAMPLSANTTSNSSANTPARRMSLSMSAGSAVMASGSGTEMMFLDGSDSGHGSVTGGPPDRGVYALERQYQQQELLRRLYLEEVNNHDTYLADLMLFHRATNRRSEMNVRAFDLLEDSSTKMQANDVAINLQLFDGIVEKSNPK
ncbi:uncharacterized protein SAPINGB_P000275 [Magnusiomyces paraingens]|uniref:Mediator of RNA polymerase II transcription subunit 12 n=1 Tax=Magnusiomyces paraingens TaxID=2606893 RepID=A0A5E8AYK2_9ASCO|nr:uncharacterized protein SAPINGB_P000275 [Saprochaete ingens]VVT44046.1 unnamed protein product [Saprochaete ingens]